MLKCEALTKAIIGAAIEVHREMGPGLLKSVYEQCLCKELALRQLSFNRQMEVPLSYRGEPLDDKLRIDVLVEDAVVLELKSVDALLPIHKAQLLTYMKLCGKDVGLLINFNVALLTKGIERMVL